MQKTSSQERLSSLLACKVFTADGKLLGHVADIQLSEGPERRVVALFFGEQGWLYRLHLLNPFLRSGYQHQKPNRIPWDGIDRIEGKKIILKPDCVPY